MASCFLSGPAESKWPPVDDVTISRAPRNRYTHRSRLRVEVPTTRYVHSYIRREFLPRSLFRFVEPKICFVTRKFYQTKTDRERNVAKLMTSIQNALLKV